ncbi:MAG: hypothetical protein ABIH53_03110 [archaeon]
MSELKSIKLEGPDFNRVIEAKQQLMLNGINALPNEIRNVIKQELREELQLTNGLIVGLGALLLINILSDREN